MSDIKQQGKHPSSLLGRITPLRPIARLECEPLESRELLSGTWTPLANLPTDPGGIQSLMLLTDGSVLAQGGGGAASASWYRLTPDSSGSYVDGAFTRAAASTTARSEFGSSVLPSGQLLVVGGAYTGLGNTFSNTDTGEVFNPTSNTWAPVSPFPESQFGDAPVEVLANGTVLAGSTTAQTYLFNPTTNTWTTAATRLRGEPSGGEQWVKLPDGSILSYDIYASISSGTGSAQRYIPSSNTWVDAGTVPVGLTSLATGLEVGPGILLPDGRVFQLGATGTSAFYTPSTNSWSVGPVIPDGLGADGSSAALEPNGDVLFAADTPVGQGPTALFEFDPVANTITAVSTPPSLTAALQGSASATQMVVLPSGDILISTGTDQLWDYTPSASPLAASQPTIASVTQTGTYTYTLSGTQLNGVSEGSAGGGFSQNATNFPLVELTNSAGAVTFVPTSNWSSVVASGSTQKTTAFTVPASLAPGSYSLAIVADGVSSSPVAFSVATPVTTYADTHWTGLANGTQIADADPVAAGNQSAVIGATAFASVNAAITAAGPFGIVIVNGDDGSGQYGKFSDAVSITTGLTFTVQGGAASFGSLSDSNANSLLTVNSPTLTTGANNTSTTVTATINGTGSLVKVGTGVLTLSAMVNGYSGGSTQVDGGTLSIAADSSLGAGGNAIDLAGGTLSVTGTTVFTTNRSVYLTPGVTDTINVADIAGAIFNGPIADAPGQSGGTLTKSGAGTLVPDGTNTYSGSTTILSGELTAYSDQNLGAATGPIALNGGYLRVFGTAYTTTTRTITLGASGGGIDIATQSNVFTLNQKLSGGGLVKQGAGTLTLTNTSNNYTGYTDIAAGTLSVNADGELGASSNYIGMIGGTLQITGSTVYTTMRYVYLLGGTLDTINVTNSVGAVFAGYVLNYNSNAGSLIKSGTGILSLQSSNYFSGGTYINGGEVSVTADSNLGNSAGGIVLNGGYLRVYGTAYTSTARSILIGPNGGGFDIAGSTTTFTVNQQLTGTGGVSKYGPGTLVLGNATNTFSGGYDVLYQGTLSIANDGDLGASLNYLDLEGGNLTVTGTSPFTSARGVYVAAGFSDSITIADPQGATFSGNLSDFPTDPGGVLVTAGPGLLTLTGTDTNAGGISVTTGAVQIGAGGTAGSVVGSLAVSTGAVLMFDRSNIVSQGTPIAGGGTVEQVGSGALILAGENTYTGPTKAMSGFLAVAAPGGSISSSSTVTVASAATFGGNGMVAGPVVVSGVLDPAGSYSPGPSGAGVLETGSLTFSAGSTYLVQLDSATAYSAVAATGTVNLTNATLNLTSNYTPSAGDSFTIVSATGGVTGQFNGLANDSTVTSNGQTFQVQYTPNSVQLVPLVSIAPTVTSVVINGGAVQRSEVTSIAVVFQYPTTIQTGAFTLTRQSDGTAITDGGPSPQVQVSTTDNLTYTLTFVGASPAVENGSLADGVWILNINHALVSAGASPGGTGMVADYSTPSGGSSRIFRLFGDSNGDGSVNGADFSEFAAAYGAGPNDPNYNSTFDFTGSDQAINGADFTAFSDRYGLSL